MMKKYIIWIFGFIFISAILYFYIFGSIIKEDCHKPLMGWLVPEDKIPHLRPIMKIYLRDDGIVKWNNVNINDRKFIELMNILYNLDPYPFVLFNYDKNVDCSRLKFIRKEMEENLDCAKGRCGEGVGWQHDDGVIILH